MIKDDIFYGNILGLLKTGKWQMGAKEAVALVQIIEECDRRLKPPVIQPVKEPVKKKTSRKKKEPPGGTNGNQ